MISDTNIENIQINEIKIGNDYALFNKPEIKEKIVSLLPTLKRESISFHVKNSNTAIANAIRRVVTGELNVKFLTCNVQDIITDEDYINKDELITRINHIPIDQDTPMDTEFSLNITNVYTDHEYLTVYSKDFVKIKGNSNKKGFDDVYRISELRSGKHLIVTKIKVTEDSGYNNSAASITNDYEYEITDFIIVTIINERANFIKHRVKTTDLVALMKKTGIKATVNEDDLFKKNIIIIPNKDYEKNLSTEQKQSIQKYDIIIENPVAWNITGFNDNDKYIKTYQSAETYSRNIYLKFNTFGNINIKKLIFITCENIIKRLTIIKKAIIEYDNNLNQGNAINKTEGIVTITKDNVKTHVLVRGEDHTISNLIKKAIFELNPSISLINTPSEHPLNRTFIINIIHNNPIKIILDGFDLCINNFEKIKKNFI